MSVYRIVGKFDTDTDFYRNCKRNRGRKKLPKCCEDCPMRSEIEHLEKIEEATDD